MSKTVRKFDSASPRTLSASNQDGKRTHLATDEAASANVRPSNNAKKDQPEASHWWKTFTNDLRIFILTLATLIALVFYTYYTRLLVIDTATSYTAVQRAFVTPLPIQVDQTTINGQKGWMFTTIVENSGATPTKGMNFHQYKPCFRDATGTLTMNMEGQDLYCDFDVEHGQVMPNTPIDPAKYYGKNGMIIGRYPLGPHAKVIIGKVTATQKQIAGGWYISGMIYYNDVFAGTVQHQTKYCYIVSLWPFDGPDVQPVFTPCEKWNCVDDECL
jgi:hypothetical protein